ncbi:ATPase-like protein [Coemansia erecta]|nr:ATPase-like protein [Coemansia erecta]
MVGNSSSINISDIVVLAVTWQLLSLTTLMNRYVDRCQTSLFKKLESLLDTKALEMYMSSRCETYNVWSFNERVREVSFGVSVLCIAFSSTLAQTFNTWVIAKKVGWRFLIPISIALANQVLSHFVTRKLEKLRKKNRISKMPQFQKDFYSMYGNIRTIKFYSWESVFSSVLGWFDYPDYRPPVFWRVTSHLIDALGCATSQIAAALTIISYFSVSTKTVTYAEVALLISSIESLTQFTKTMTAAGETMIKVRKGIKFLQSLTDTKSKEFIKHEIDVPKDGTVVELKDCVFSWGEEKFKLKPISLRINAGDFVTIVGRVGGGKSSLVSGLCGEMEVESGHGRVCGQIGYVSQKPFIMNATLRENIMMGAEYDEKLMEKVIKASALTEDIKHFTAGDMTEIGSNGVNLSGGQKVRLALARALYLNADVYLFDDLLSAVDARVERLIVERILAPGGIISDKARILVTHAEHIVPLSSKVIKMDGGEAVISEQQPEEFNSEPHSNSDLENTDSSEDKKDSSEDNDAEKDEFVIHPDLEKTLDKKTELLRFLKMSGYATITIVAIIQMISAYAIHYVESLRINLMVDNNPDTIQESMKTYLIVNAVLEIGSQQIRIIENFVRNKLWSDKVSAMMRQEITKAILSLPLPLVERLPKMTIMQMFLGDRYRTAVYLPRRLCSEVVFDVLMTMSTIAQAVKTSPYILILCIPPICINYLQKMLFRGLYEKMWKMALKSIYHPSDHVTSMLLSNRTLLRVHGNAPEYMDKYREMSAAVINYDSTVGSISTSRYLMSNTCSEAIRTGVLSFKLWQRIFKHQHVTSGEIDVLTRISLRVTTRVSNMIALTGKFDEELRSLSRFHVYTKKLDCEAQAIVQDNRPLPSWPQKGIVEFRDYSMRYRSELDLVLKGLSFITRPCEKIGIVGRTGAGKSSITYALMRMVEAAAGQIIIDGVDISQIGLYDLRSRIAIIPQDPTLFEGTIRDNLDPSHEYSDDEVWAAIRAGGIESLVETPTEKYIEEEDNDEYSEKGPWTERVGLEKWVEYNGNNFSVGQRQLVSLCRALLWRRRVVVLDEATANVDGETDKIMQEVIRTQFNNCTVLTIAHRLDTIMDSDRILVMDQGCVAEFDTPKNLLANKDSQFTLLVGSMKLNQRK